MKIPKKILITGASSGVGCSLAHHFAEDFEVIVTARREERLREEFGSSQNVSIHQTDLANRESIRKFLEQLDREHGFVPYLINNAGVNRAGGLKTLEVDKVDHSVQVNAVAPLMLMKHHLSSMRERNFGRIINVTSGAPLNCFPGYGAYSGSKALLNALTVTMAKEHSGYNIKINLMSPGPVRSEMSPDSDLKPDVCHPMTEHLLHLPEDGPTGRFFWLKYEVPLFPDLEGVQWLQGKGNDKLTEVI